MTKLQNRNNILKALAGTSSGMSKELLLTTYKAIGQSILNYGCPIDSGIVQNALEKSLNLPKCRTKNCTGMCQNAICRPPPCRGKHHAGKRSLQYDHRTISSSNTKT